MPAFLTSVLTATTPVIAEIKLRTGDGDELLAGRSVEQLVEQFERLGAPCLSVVTGSWFGGHRELLGQVVARSGLPVLEKDIVVSERRIAEAKAAGAAAVLLTAGLVSSSRLARLVETCLDLDLTPFVEVSTAGQVERVAHADRCVLAAANKQIRQRERGDGDTQRSLGVLPAIRAAGGGCAVSASGIATPAAGARLLTAGFDALLVGTALLRSDSARAWVDELSSLRQAASRGRSAGG
jgi:indole-3-glycerol phosphate synthase